jgi:hypothetical protein
LPTGLENMRLFIQQQHGQFSEIRSEGQVIATSRYAKQKKYESMEDYYD